MAQPSNPDLRSDGQISCPSRSMWLVTVLLVALAVDVNWFAPVMFGSHRLIFGLTIYWLALLRIGPVQALPVLAAGTLTLTLKWSQPFTGLLFALEGLLVGLAWRRWRSAVLVDVLFWVCFGTPASWFIYKYVSVIPHPSFEQALILQPVNGLVAVLATFFFLEVLPDVYDREPVTATNNFRSYLLKRYLAFGTFPVIVGGFVAARSFESHTLGEVGANLGRSAERITVAVNLRLDVGLETIREIAARQSDKSWFMDPARLSGELSETLAAQPAFLTMLAADSSGNILATAARSSFGPSPPVALLAQINDREYFSAPMATGQSHVSNLFRGRGLGSDFLVALSAPVVAHSGERLGVIEGSLLASELSEIILPSPEESSLVVLLCDRSKHVIAAHGMDFPTLSPIADTPVGQMIDRNSTATTRIALDDASEKKFYLIHTVPVPLTDWSLTVLRPWADVMQPVMGAYAWILAIALCTALCAAIFARWSIHNFLRFWQSVMDFSHSPNLQPALLKYAAPAQLPLEFSLLVDNLVVMAQRVESEEDNRGLLLAELESRVVERTKELEIALAAAKNADHAKNAFLSTVTHELRTPLTAIITGVRLLRISKSNWSEREARTLVTLEKSSHSLMNVISEVLDYSKLESDSVTLHPRIFRPAELIADVILILTPAAKQANLDLHQTIEHTPEMEWHGDPEHLRRILLNLAGNAVKFTLEGLVEIASCVELSSSGLRRLYFSVTDSGTGIPPDRLEAIFKPFVQLETDRVLAQAGTGLGLTICRKLVEKMGGEISVTSTLGKGSKFEFWIPQ